MDDLSLESQKEIERTHAHVFSSEIDTLFSRYASFVVDGDDDPFTPATGESSLELFPLVTLPLSEGVFMIVHPDITNLTVGRSNLSIENGRLLRGSSLSFIEKKEDGYFNTMYSTDGNSVVKSVQPTIGADSTYDEIEVYYTEIQAKQKLVESISLMGSEERTDALRKIKGEPIQEGELSVLVEILQRAEPLVH